MRLTPRETGLRPPVKCVTDLSKAVLSFVDNLCYFCLVSIMLSPASVFDAHLFLCPVTCWERAELLAFVCDV